MLQRIPIALCLTVAAAAAPSLHAQADWYPDALVPKPRALHTAAYDQVRDRVVVFGGNTNAGVQGDTWAWSPTGGWQQLHPAVSPPALREHAMAWDPIRAEIVLYGGWDGTQVTGDTWLFNGTDWRQANPTVSPGPRMAELAFDPTTLRVLLFGGQDGGGARYSDTWAWDGTNWTPLTSPQTPPARFDHALATDWIRGRVVMFGGWDNGFLADTWEWAGGAWTPFAGTGPSARSEHKMAFAGGDVWMFAGESAAGRQQDTWAFDGIAWRQLPFTNPPSVREEAILADLLPHGAALLFGGWHSTTGHLADTWLLTPGGWTELTPATPLGVGTAAAAHDPTTGTTLVFGGYYDNGISDRTFARRNGTWTEPSPAARPAARVESAMAYDPLRSEFVLFGGVNGSSNYADTWVFRGGNWVQRSPATSPQARWGHAMTFDASRGTVVLFSGRLGGTSGTLQDTWEWDGTTWSPILGQQPPPREDGALAYDPGRGATVLFGGWVTGTGFANDTWVLRNGLWSFLPTSASPPGRSEHVLAADLARGGLLMFGGETASGRVADTWELTDDWHLVGTAHAPAPREEAIMVFDAQQGEIVMSVGWDLGHYRDTWNFGARPPATSVSFGTGCRGSAPTLPVLSSTRPWLGGNLAYTVDGTPANAAALLVFGAQRTQIPLDPIGMPGCILATLVEASSPMVVSGNRATVALALPNLANLAGVRLVNQSAMVVPGVNPLGVLTTNGLEATLALR
ncbi:MAG: hypothetical protein IPM29_05190 [Planctomycetes bacterium]|nr:hypothetical protein [Planctomycetota bacterium]